MQVGKRHACQQHARLAFESVRDRSRAQSRTHVSLRGLRQVAAGYLHARRILLGGMAGRMTAFDHDAIL